MPELRRVLERVELGELGCVGHDKNTFQKVDKGATGGARSGAPPFDSEHLDELHVQRSNRIAAGGVRGVTHLRRCSAAGGRGRAHARTHQN